MNIEQDDRLTNEEKNLVAMGAAMGAGCRTCADKLYTLALSLNIPEAMMVTAFDGGLAAKAQAVRTMEAKISALTGDKRRKDGSASGCSQKLSSLVRIASFVAANSAPDALAEIRKAKAEGIAAEQIGIAVSLAKMVRKNALSFSDQEISDNACGDELDGEEMCCPLSPHTWSGSACSCG